MRNSFKDNFSRQSDIYVKYRPHYPQDLYRFLTSLTNEHELAWDCGTGNGQAAIGLANYYEEIVATDPSENQIRHAMPHEKIKYLVEQAEDSSLNDNSVDLVTVSNALHWLDFDRFYKEAKRVMKPAGVIAAWSYGLPFIDGKMNDVLSHYHYKTLDGYWLPENGLIEEEYKTIPFPFETIEAPDFYYEKEFSLPEFIGYLNTWSATQRYIDRNHVNPTEAVFNELQSTWNSSDEKRKLTWKLILLVGRS
jgi:SAM-dependent methyltransferase